MSDEKPPTQVKKLTTDGDGFKEKVITFDDLMQKFSVEGRKKTIEELRKDLKKKAKQVNPKLNVEAKLAAHSDKDRAHEIFRLEIDHLLNTTMSSVNQAFVFGYVKPEQMHQLVKYLLEQARIYFHEQQEIRPGLLDGYDLESQLRNFLVQPVISVLLLRYTESSVLYEDDTPEATQLVLDQYAGLLDALIQEMGRFSTNQEVESAPPENIDELGWVDWSSQKRDVELLLTLVALIRDIDAVSPGVQSVVSQINQQDFRESISEINQKIWQSKELLGRVKSKAAKVVERYQEDLIQKSATVQNSDQLNDFFIKLDTLKLVA